MEKFHKVCVVGLGYVGLPTAAILANYAMEVVGVDLNARAVDLINQGKIHIVEPDLEAMVHHAVTTGRLRAVSAPQPADAFLIAVPTPFLDGHVPDLSYVKAVAKSIAPVIKKGDLIILESTSPVGTTENLTRWLADLRPDLSFPDRGGNESDVQVAYCPERVLPGRVLRELVENDRIIGGITRRCATRAADLYKAFVKGSCLITDSRTAEMAKLTENSFRDVNIAFANELSMICDKLEIDTWELISLANCHPRVKILQPGPGVGGHCIAVDPWFIVDSAKEEAQLIRKAREVNDHKPVYVMGRIRKQAMRFREPVIALLGLAYKPDIDDLRESPAVHIAQELASDKVGKILAVEPHIDELPATLGEHGVQLLETREAIAQADIVVFLVNHSGFAELTRDHLSEKIVLDFCGGLRR